jgi:hypothetical protein
MNTWERIPHGHLLRDIHRLRRAGSGNKQALVHDDILIYLVAICLDNYQSPVFMISGFLKSL